MMTKIKALAIAGIALGFATACQTTGLKSEGDPNRVLLSSFNVKSTNPATLANWKDSPLEVEGVMSYPNVGGSGPYPAIIYLLSSGGYNRSYDGGWVNIFNEAGYATLMVNQFTARGLSLSTGLGSKQSGITNMSYLSDIYAAVRSLKNNPRIDGARLATFGMSWGGGIQMYLMSDWYNRNVGDGMQIKAHIALAPNCPFNVENPKPTSGSMLMLLGELDNWNLPGPCKDYAKRLVAAGADVKVMVVKGASHAWDTQHPVRGKSNVTVYHCQITWNTKTMHAQEKRTGNKADFGIVDDTAWENLWNDCTKKTTVYTGGTTTQRSQTENAVTSFLREKL